MTTPPFTGSIEFISVPSSVVTHLKFDTLDLDSYMPATAPGSSSTSATSSTVSAVPLLALLGPAVGLKLRFAKVIYRGDTAAH